MRALQRLVRNGNSTQVTIPRAILMHLGWLPSEEVIVTVLEDKSLHIRRPTTDDFLVRTSVGVLPTPASEVR